MLDFHGEFRGLRRRTRVAGDLLERRVLQTSAAVVLSSAWAADSARLHYGRRQRLSVVPFGANLDRWPEENRWQRASTCRLLFVGVDWRDKGADIAVAATKALNDAGVPATLDVVGCRPPESSSLPASIHCHGFLRKSVPDEYRRLTELFEQADFFVLPTRFEAFGIVFCEAAAYGTPSIGPRIGGIPTIIEDEVTGVLMDRDASPVAYAARIAAVWQDPPRYASMRRAARSRASSALNWQAWGDAIESIVNDVALGSASPS